MPANSSGARLFDRRPGAEEVERAVGLKVARALLDELQQRAYQCEENVRASGAGAALYPTAASIANFIDCKLARLPPAPLEKS